MKQTHSNRHLFSIQYFSKMPPPQNALDNTHCVCVTAHHTPRRRSALICWNCWSTLFASVSATTSMNIGSSSNRFDSRQLHGRRLSSSRGSSKANDDETTWNILQTTNRCRRSVALYDFLWLVWLFYFLFFSLFRGKKARHRSHLHHVGRRRIVSHRNNLILFSRALLLCVFDVCPLEARPYRPHQVIF